MRRAIAAVLMGLVLTGCVRAAAPSLSMPGPGEVWFGTARNGYQLTERIRTAAPGDHIALSARFIEPVSVGQRAGLRVDEQSVKWSGVRNDRYELIGSDFTAPWEPGRHTVEVVRSDGLVLAIGFLTVV